MELTYITGESLAEILTALNLPCDFLQMKINCTHIKYHFNLRNLQQLSKLKRAVAMLSAHIHERVDICESPKGHFCLAIKREQREYPKFMVHHPALENKPTGEILFGLDENGEPVTNNILSTKSILIAGSSGGGKSVLLSNIICSLACYSNPKQLSMTLIDLKRCEFSLFKNLGHLNHEIVKDYDTAISVLRTIRAKVQQRYEEMERDGIRKATTDKYPIICVIIDEYAELVSRGNKTELDGLVASISATGRACNIFLIIATQHAVSSVISNVIKSNMQTKIGLRTTNTAQSICAIGSRDCVDLLGNGDSYIYFDGTPKIQRVQVCNVTDEDIYEMTAHLPPRTWNTPKPTPPPRKTTWLGKLLDRIAKGRDRPQKQGENTIDTLNNIDCIDDDEE